MKVNPDKWEGYAEAILKLYDNERLFKSIIAAGEPVHEKFFNKDNSWGAKFRKGMLEHVL